MSEQWEFIGPSCVRIGKVELHPGDGKKARLIYAAPDLLQALELLGAATNSDGWPQGWGAVRDAAEAAVAKARGKQ